MAFTTPPAQPQPIRSETFIPWADSYVAWQAQYVGEMTAYQGALTAIASGAAQSIAYTVSSTTTDADPTDGFLRFSDFADQTAATVLRLALVDAGAATQTAVIDTFDDSTSTVKGYIRLVKLNDPTKFLIFSVSALASPSGYRNVTVAHVAGSGTAPFASNDSIILQFARTGDKGDTGTAAPLFRIERTSNTIITSANNGNWIDIVSGSFTQTFDPAATLGDGFSCFLGNSGTGDVALPAPLSFTMYPGEIRIVQSDGSTLNTILVKEFEKTFESSDDFIKPPGYSAFGGLLGGGGGGGGGGRVSTTTNGSAGGGGGAVIPFTVLASALPSLASFVCGAAGAAGVAGAPPTDGGNGGNSVFIGYTAFGGAGGRANNTAASAGGGWLSAGSTGTAGTGSVLLFDSGVAAGGTVPSIWGGGVSGPGGASNSPPAAITAISRFGGCGGGGSGGTSSPNRYAGVAGAANSGVAGGGTAGAIDGGHGGNGVNRGDGGGGGGSIITGTAGNGGNGVLGGGGGGGGGAQSGTGGTGGTGGSGYLMIWGIA